VVDDARRTIEVTGVVWDTVDVAHEQCFPDDVDATWQNATLLTVVIGSCKAIATCHPAARQLYPNVEKCMKAFWLTVFAGQLGRQDKFHVSTVDGEKMTYMDWLPEVDPSWSAGAPVLTPFTGGLTEMAQMAHDDQEIQKTFVSESGCTETWFDWGSSVDDQDCQTSTHVIDDRRRMLGIRTKDWTDDQIQEHEDEFTYLASLWNKQPYDLYRRPFNLLNVVPDPYWHLRRERDELARRKTWQHRSQNAIIAPADGILPGTPL